MVNPNTESEMPCRIAINIKRRRIGELGLVTVSGPDEAYDQATGGNLGIADNYILACYPLFACTGPLKRSVSSNAADAKLGSALSRPHCSG